ncbi:polysaccharide lyase [Pseudonocardia spinosispora]|uniref:polysaccharide lyase n=1 Tax=Pseudonocardia spinosispora TaxID=103441 RepID=UPI00055F0264
MVGSVAAGLLSVIIVIVPGPADEQRQTSPERPPAPSVEASAVPSAGSEGGSGVAPGSAGLVRFFGNSLGWRGQGSFGLDRLRVTDDASTPAGRVLRVSYPAGSASPQAARKSGGAQGGAQAYLPLSTPRNSARLSFWVRFPPGFDFVKGGKLPGLYGGSGGSGGKHRDDGFSTRFMWRAGGVGEVYVYLPGGTGYGTSLGRGSWKFTPGRWTQVTQQVQLNTAGQADGALTVWVDGRQVFTQGGLTYRTGQGPLIDGLFFSSFFGGSDTSWASPRDQHVDFTGFTLTD